MRLLLSFLSHLIVTSFGLWIAVRLFGTTTADYSSTQEIMTFLTAGFLLSVITVFIKPIVSIISLPITILTLGLFTLVINGLMVYLAIWWTDGLEMSFLNSILAGIIIGIVNYIIGHILGALKAED